MLSTDCAELNEYYNQMEVIIYTMARGTWRLYFSPPFKNKFNHDLRKVWKVRTKD
jgi:hypothetical protein